MQFSCQSYTVLEIIKHRVVFGGSNRANVPELLHFGIHFLSCSTCVLPQTIPVIFITTERSVIQIKDVLVCFIQFGRYYLAKVLWLTFIIESDQKQISSELNIISVSLMLILEFIYNYICKLLISSSNRFPFGQTTWQEWSKFSHRKFSLNKWWHHMQWRFQSQQILMRTFQASCLSIVSTSY
jgi:hypothetical protein